MRNRGKLFNEGNVDTAPKAKGLYVTVPFFVWSTDSDFKIGITLERNRPLYKCDTMLALSCLPVNTDIKKSSTSLNMHVNLHFNPWPKASHES